MFRVVAKSGYKFAFVRRGTTRRERSSIFRENDDFNRVRAFGASATRERAAAKQERDRRPVARTDHRARSHRAK